MYYILSAMAICFVSVLIYNYIRHRDELAMIKGFHRFHLSMAHDRYKTTKKGIRHVFFKR